MLTFGVDIANQGRFRGSCDVTGVHCVVAVAIENYKELLCNKTVGVSSARYKNKQTELLSLVDPSPDKLERINTRRRNKDTAYVRRRDRALAANAEAEFDCEAEEEWEYAEE